MEQAAGIARRSGWDERETRLLWETADEAQSRGLPLKQVFERLAEQTGRRPNSIRNYYYAQVRSREGGAARAARFVPFSEEEIAALMDEVLRARANGQSVRSCLARMSGGDHSLMLRYQNKYRAVLKSRPDAVRASLERLEAEGVNCPPPEVKPRSQQSVEQAAERLVASAEQVGDAELARSLEVLAKLITNGRDGAKSVDRQQQVDRLNVRLDLYRLALSDKNEALARLTDASQELAEGIKEFLALDQEARNSALADFCVALSERIGALERAVTEAESPQAALD